jgi:hypothetical protein
MTLTVLQVLVAALVFGYALLFAKKRIEYRGLRRRQENILAEHAGDLRLRELDTEEVAPFEDRLIKIDGLLSDDAFLRLRTVIDGNTKGERIHIPGHKRGVTISYEALHRCAPEVVALYHSPELHALCSRIVGERIQVTPLHDQSSCSVLRYESSGDNIGWHRDLNFYKGRHFTALLFVINESSAGRLSSAELTVRTPSSSRDFAVVTPPNTFVFFEGARVWHKVTPLGEDERRVVLSMTFATNPAANPLQSAVRRFKDVAYYGVRALWT